MCGIGGIASATSAHPVSEDALERMCKGLAHRGPDGVGVHSASGVGLVHTRLSVIDLDGGKQPLCNEDGSVWIAFNGEIYNFVSLRRDLLSRGHQFRTSSDTEVLVHLYEEYGLDFVHHLNGMFAVALHDMRSGRVVLARDHFGIKPLFYTLKNDQLIFGSEIKAVLAGAGMPAETTLGAVQEYLLFRSIGDDRSFFRNIKRLRPGSIGVWEGGELKLSRFWSPPVPHPDLQLSEGRAVQLLDEYLEDAVRMQLMSDVPLGTFCSGGVDSGLTSWYAARHSVSPLHTFSVGFNESEWDETRLARDTAARIGSQHHVLVASSDAFAESLPRSIWHHDEPLGHPNSVLISLLSGYAREHVTVVLTGEGSDELFGGYPRHQIISLSERLRRLPRPARSVVVQALRQFGGRKGGLLANATSLPEWQAVAINASLLEQRTVEQLTGASAADVVEQRVAHIAELAIPNDPLATVTRYDQLYYLPALLDRMDRMTMAFGLEGRVPFLDVRLAEWASKVPTSLKISRLENKRVVKALADRYLSPQVVRGPKSGFGVPFGQWLRTEKSWRQYAERLTSSGNRASQFLDTAMLATAAEDHMAGRAKKDDLLWQSLNVILWHETAY